MNIQDHETAATPPPPPPPGGTTSSPPPPPPPLAGPGQEERTWGMFAHLAGLTAVISGIGMILGPLVVWLIKRDTMPFVDDQGKEALNFGITCGVAMFLLVVIGTPLLIVLIGFLFYLAAFAVGVFWLVFTIIAGIKANEGVAYRYPVNVRLVK